MAEETPRNAANELFRMLDAVRNGQLPQSAQSRPVQAQAYDPGSFPNLRDPQVQNHLGGLARSLGTDVNKLTAGILDWQSRMDAEIRSGKRSQLEGYNAILIAQAGQDARGQRVPASELIFSYRDIAGAGTGQLVILQRQHLDQAEFDRRQKDPNPAHNRIRGMPFQGQGKYMTNAIAIQKLGDRHLVNTIDPYAYWTPVDIEGKPKTDEQKVKSLQLFDPRWVGLPLDLKTMVSTPVKDAELIDLNYIGVPRPNPDALPSQPARPAGTWSAPGEKPAAPAQAPAQAPAPASTSAPAQPAASAASGVDLSGVKKAGGELVDKATDGIGKAWGWLKEEAKKPRPPTPNSPDAP